MASLSDNSGIETCVAGRRMRGKQPLKLSSQMHVQCSDTSAVQERESKCNCQTNPVLRAF